LKYKIQYKASVKKDLQKIDKKEVIKILDTIDSVLSNDPTKGKQLTGEYSGLLSYRTGNYRIVYAILKESILILRIGHRKNVYR
jgi:mRNA interferase RelE/StbE